MSVRGLRTTKRFKDSDSSMSNMRLVTIQASAIKSTFEVLKDILNDVNIIVSLDVHTIT